VYTCEKHRRLYGHNDIRILFHHIFFLIRLRSRSFVAHTGGLRVECCDLRVPFRTRKTFYFLYSLQASCGVHPSPFSIGYEGLFPGHQSELDVNLIIHLCLLQMLRIRGSLTPLPHTSSWHRDSFTLTFL
jgi:hypothetical protein